MAIGGHEFGAQARHIAPVSVKAADRLADLLANVPRPIRFLSVGVLGLLTDLGTFTLIVSYGVHPLLARIGSLLVATLVTWRLNRALTFDQTMRRQGEEAMRYGIVTLIAQGTSYAVFSLLVLSIASPLPQAAVIVGAAVGALVGYSGHRLFAFAPTARPGLSQNPNAGARHAG